MKRVSTRSWRRSSSRRWRTTRCSSPAIALLVELHAPEWMKPLLKLFFTISYVVLAPFVGVFADAIPKGRVMFVTNTVKVLGCALMFRRSTRCSRTRWSASAPPRTRRPSTAS
jgi:hypothetical protein